MSERSRARRRYREVLMGAGFVTVYWLDSEDRIVRVSESWDAFALSNQGGSSCWTHVQGRPLWEFVSDEATRRWVSTLIGHVRLHGGEIERPYRCDSPTERRHMAMRIVSEGGGRLRVEHTVLRSEAREHPVFVQPVHRIGVRANRRCSVCGRVGRGPQWFEPDAEQARELADPSQPLTVIYGVCEPCLQMLPQGATAAS